MRLTEELVNLIVRNTVSNGISLRDIELTFFLEGYTKLKNSDIREDNSQLSKMVYAKIYENEHIGKVREAMLLEVRDIIKDFEEMADTKKKTFGIRNIAKLVSSITLVIGFILCLFALQGVVSSLLESKNLNDSMKVIILIVLLLLSLIVIPLIINIVIKPLKIEIDNLITIMDSNFSAWKSQRTKNKTIPATPVSPPVPSLAVTPEITVERIDGNSTTNQFKTMGLEKYISNENLVVEVFLHRFVLEKLITTLYLKKYGYEDRNFSFSKKVNQLIYEEKIPKGFGETIKSLYSWSSKIVHGGDTNINQSVNNDKLRTMKEIMISLRNELSGVE